MFRKLTVIALILTVAAVLVPPVSAANEQVITPGDILSITALGEPDLTKRVVVDSYGKITLPLANEVEVGGLTTTEAAAKLRNQLSQFIKNPQVTIEIAEPAKRMVVVSGAVKTPGLYEIGLNSNVLGVLTQAGGYTPEADLSSITITRGQKRDTILSVNMAEFLSGSRPEANIAVLPGDTIVVPERNPVQGMIFVLGEVNQRGPMQMRQGMTLREAIASAGGVTTMADTTKVTLKHKDDTVGAPVDFIKASSGDPTANVALLPGDTIFVPGMESQGMFTIIGPVARPGQYPIRGSMYVTDAVAAAGGTTERGNLSSVRLNRGSGDRMQTFKLNVPKITEGRAQNVAIQPGDTILVSERKEPVDKMRAGGLLVSILYLLTR
ncbi:MAG: SLBB domain-containing protein [Armatimonadota bacterium]|nr:SLBB domain-containing protein [Armatimonadota bacterium]